MVDNLESEMKRPPPLATQSQDLPVPSPQGRTPNEQSPRSVRPVSVISGDAAPEDFDDLRQRMEEQNKIGSVEQKQTLCQRFCKPCYNLKNRKELFKSATFREHVKAGQKETEYDIRSLWILHGDWTIRKKLVWLIEWKPFENFITLVILANSVMLACTDYSARLYGEDYISIQNLNMTKVDDAFSIIFLCECIFKVLAMGFILHKNSYMRDRWNWLDIFVVTISVVTWLPGIEGNSSMKSLRTFRILRPLRSINSLPSMKALIQSLLSSIPGMVNVFIFLAFIFTIFAIFGTHQFVGSQYYRCRMTLEPTVIPGNENGDKHWPINFDAEWLCRTDGDCERMLGGDGKDPVHKCGTMIDVGLPVELDEPRTQELISFDIVNFNNVGLSLLLIFQSLTLEGWVLLMYNFMDSNDYWISIIYFCFMVIFGSFFAMQLVLAQIMDSFAKDQAKKNETVAEEEVKEQQSLNMAKLFVGVGKKDPTTGSNLNLDKPGSALSGLKSDGLGLIGDTNLGENTEKEVKIANNAEINKDILQKVDDKVSPEDPNLAKEEHKLNISKDEDDNALDEWTSGLNQEQFPGQDADDDSDSEFEDETQYEVAARDRSKKNWCYAKSYALVNHPLYNFIVFVLILANTIVLAADDYPQSLEKEMVIKVLNDFFTWAFFAEMIIKMIALGVNNYIHDKFNLFDAIVVSLSLIDWCLTIILTKEQKSSVGSSMQALRALRLLRVIKLARSWTKLQDIIGKTVSSLKDISNFGVLLFLFMYIFALLGMELFANNIRLTWDEEIISDIPAFVKSEGIMIAPRYNFDNVYNALIVVFCAILGEDWNNSMYSFINPGIANEYATIGYFLLLLILGNIMLLSLFTAILLQKFETTEEDLEAQKAKPKPDFSVRKVFTWNFFIKTKNAVVGIFETRSKKTKTKKEQTPPASAEKDNKKAQDGKEKGKTETNIRDSKLPNAIQTDQKGEGGERNNAINALALLHYEFGDAHLKASIARGDTLSTKKSTVVIPQVTKLHGWSLKVLGPENSFRLTCNYISSHRYFERFIISLILISTVALALQTPLDAPDSKMVVTLVYIDYFMTGFFICEMFTKIFALGFLFNGADSYIRNAWNILDFLIVISATTSVIFTTIDLGFIKSLRVMRVLRPLRLLSRHRGLKLAISALFNSLPNIANLLLIVMFFIFMMAILCCTLFSGQFWYCETEHLGLDDYMMKYGIKNRYDCLMFGGEWVNPDFQFDTTMESMLTLLSIQSTEGWVDTMWYMIDVEGQEIHPVRDSKRYYCVFAIALTVLMTLLFLNLFVGVVIESFNVEKEELSLNKLLRKVDMSWIETCQLCYSAKPRISTPFTQKRFRDGMIKICNSSKFDNFILLCILGNTMSLTLKWYGQSQAFTNSLETVNLVFGVIFTIEAIMKIIAYRRNYFRDAWNKFDFTVVILTWLVLIILQFELPFDVSILGMIARTLRIGRVFRLSKRVQAIQVILMTLVEAIPSISALGILLGLLFFLYSIIGMSQFCFMKLGGELNYHVNFQSFINGVLLLMRNATGEAWDTIMYDYMRERSITFQCVPNFDYYDWLNQDKEMNGCGNPTISIVFFYSFNVVVSQIFLNLFIAIIIDSFMSQSNAYDMPVNQGDIDDFIDCWQKYDQEGHGTIECYMFEQFIVDLANINGCRLLSNKKRILKSTIHRRKLIASFEIPCHDSFKSFYFIDVLQCMSRQVVEQKFIREHIADIKSQQVSANQMKLNAKNKAEVDAAIRRQLEVKEQQVEDPKLTFRKAVLGISKLDPNIASVGELTRTAKAVARKGFKNIDIKQLEEESEVYSSKHYIYGELIVKCWRDFVKVKVENEVDGQINSPSQTLQES